MLLFPRMSRFILQLLLQHFIYLAFHADRHGRGRERLAPLSTAVCFKANLYIAA